LGPSRHVTLFVTVAGISIAIYGLHRLALFAESRGWIFYKTRPPRVRTLGLLEELIEPEVEHMIEAKPRRRSGPKKRGPAEPALR